MSNTLVATTVMQLLANWAAWYGGEPAGAGFEKAIEMLDKMEAPAITSGYAITIAFGCIIDLVRSVSSLVTVPVTVGDAAAGPDAVPPEELAARVHVVQPATWDEYAAHGASKRASLAPDPRHSARTTSRSTCAAWRVRQGACLSGSQAQQTRKSCTLCRMRYVG